jgi:hypothetical protein
VDGGIFSWGGVALIQNNWIEGNYWNNNWGSGIVCKGPGMTIAGNIIIHNEGLEHSGGIHIEDDPCTVINNIIAWNKALGHGGGVYINHFDNTGSAVLVNNVIYQNTAEGPSAKGGGIYCNEPTQVVNTIVWDNEAAVLPEIYKQTVLMEVTYCDIKGGFSGTGNIDQDPLFVDPANGDFHLNWLSPCINRGTNDGAPSEDIDGDPRPHMGTVDMGVDEFVGIHPLTADGFTLSESTGGTINYTLDAGDWNASRNYFLLGSISGTESGIPLPGGMATLPLNWDFFTNIVINMINGFFFQNFAGVLDADGLGTATFNLPAGTGATGLSMYYAYALSKPYDFTSNPVMIQVVP